MRLVMSNKVIAFHRAVSLHVYSDEARPAATSNRRVTRRFRIDDQREKCILALERKTNYQQQRSNHDLCECSCVCLRANANFRVLWRGFSDLTERTEEFSKDCSKFSTTMVTPDFSW